MTRVTIFTDCIGWNEKRSATCQNLEMIAFSFAHHIAQFGNITTAILDADNVRVAGTDADHFHIQIDGRVARHTVQDHRNGTGIGNGQEVSSQHLVLFIRKLFR